MRSFLVVLLLIPSICAGGCSRAKQNGDARMSLRQQLIKKIKAQGESGFDKPFPVVSLEDFFTGNNDLGSIGCNLDEHPGMERFFAVLKSIRARPEVQDVLVTIYEYDEQDDTTWPFSERVYVLTSAPAVDLAEWAKELQPTEVLDDGFVGGVPPAAPKLRPGIKVLSLWWD
jgi:hypothetical protein